MFLFADALAMIRDIRAQGGAIGTWGGALNIPQIVGGLVFIWTPEGRWILIAAVLTLMVAGQIHKRSPFSRLTGICHLPWLLLLPWLVDRILSVSHGPILKVWLVYVAVTIAISLVFDVLDIYRYVRGDKTFAWAGNRPGA